MEVNNLQSQIFFVIRLDGDNWRLYAESQPFI